MERERHKEMIENLDRLIRDDRLLDRDVFLFAHCHATMELADELIARGVTPAAILDNNPDKHGMSYKDIPVCAPEKVLEADRAIVLIVSRFYEQMASQLRELGYTRDIEKLTDYNTYAEYSLSPDTLIRKSERLKRGIEFLGQLKNDHPGRFTVFCPFAALGDVYFCMSYLKAYLIKNGYDRCLVCVVGEGQRQVAELFGYTKVLSLTQSEMDEAVQGIIYTNDESCFIAHQDRPYVVDLHRALYIKCIPLDTIYKCGVFGLPQETEPVEPTQWSDYIGDRISDRSVIVSPYAKSVATFPDKFWMDMVTDLKDKGYEIYTNVAGDEKPLPGTKSLSPKISEMRSAVEQAGLFIGIRSGICDVIRTTDCKKIALYPNYFYCDTKWKSIDMYAIDGFKNIVVKDGMRWSDVREDVGL